MQNLLSARKDRPPLCIGWRSSYWFITLVLGIAVAVDVMAYSIIIPFIPFQLQKLGYTRVSVLTGWLLFAYSGGLVFFTFPIALWSERSNARKLPMLLGLLCLAGSLILFMEAPTYAVMCVARVIQGISSSVVWVVGLAFLCDATPQVVVGRQLGISMIGLSFGSVLAPPLGGVLYTRFGFRGPFVFCLIATLLDLTLRVIIIEPKEARKWGTDPAAQMTAEYDLDCEHTESAESQGVVADKEEVTSESGVISREYGEHRDTKLHEAISSGPVEIPASVNQHLSLPQVLVQLSRSHRAVAALVITLAYGFVFTSQEPPLPLHLQSVWNLSSERVGIIFLAISVPMAFSSPLTGWLTDLTGPEWTATISLILAIPWWVVITIEGPLVLFGVAFALASFFTSGSIAPLTAELAAVSRNTHGIGYAHVYAAFNVAYGIGTTMGPIVGGQMYEHIDKGWFAICMLAVAVLFVSVLLAVPFTGEKPLWFRFKSRMGCLNGRENT